MRRIPRVVFSAVRGGSGKTIISIGVAVAWRKHGRRIGVFKKGPDFIDAGWLGAAAGSDCYNLDLFLMEPSAILRSFAEHTMGVDAAVIEGNRGLFDGLDDAGTYSTARLARLLAAPVVLIIDCTKVTATVAALVLGCRDFDPAVSLQGVILNRVASGRQESVIRKAVEGATGIPVVGAVPRLRQEEFPERHMGLTPFQEHPEVNQAIAAAGAMAEKYIDLDALWNIASEAPDVEAPEALIGQGPRGDSFVRVGIIQDRAFQFYYPDNLEALRKQGAELVQLNALSDAALPGIDALYIGGGFPETQAAELAANDKFCASLRAAVERGLPVYAECGGLIYLGRSLQVDGKTYPMASVLPADFVLEKRPQAHGYTVLEAGENPFFPVGTVLKGHEFHYSRIANHDELSGMGLRMQRGVGIDGKNDGLVYKNVLAAYTHLHALGAPAWAEGIVRKAREYRKRAGQETG